MSRLNSDAILGQLGVPGAAGSLQELALTHRSFAFEQPEPVAHNERLEFLGDAVLGIIVTELIFEGYPEMNEGDMARMRASVVNTHALAALAAELGLGDYIRVGKGEEASGGRSKPSLLADTFEAIVGAAYVEQGIDGVRAALAPVFRERLREVERSGTAYDPKTALQEAVVRERGIRPDYRIASSGPDHDKRFTAHVYIEEELYGVGTGHSKKEAEQHAAREALVKVVGDGARVSTAVPVEGAHRAGAS